MTKIRTRGDKRRPVVLKLVVTELISLRFLRE